MGDGLPSWVRSEPRWLATWAAAWLVVAGGVGCEMRDEPVRNAGTGVFWPPTTSAADSGDADRGGRSATEPEYVEGYDAAVRLAAAERRPLFVVFGASWCRWSGALARGPLADRDIVARSRRFVCVLVDADRDAATCREFGVSAFPTMLVIDADGHERFRSTGAAGAAGLAAALDAAGTPATARRRLTDDGRRADAARDVTR